MSKHSNISIPEYARQFGINPAELLWLIRKRVIVDGLSLMMAARAKWGERSPVGMATAIARSSLHALADAELVVIDEENRFDVTPQLEKIQAVLNLSLTQLVENAGGNVVTVNPLFGPPEHVEACPDIFVLMPFSENLRPVYEDHILKIASMVGVTVGRADDFFTTGSIVADIWNAICSCKMVIADCTGRNPNVFYEIGIAHTVGKQTVLIAQSIDDVPFDLRHIRYIVYDYTPRGMNNFDEALLATINSNLDLADRDEDLEEGDGDDS